MFFEGIPGNFLVNSKLSKLARKSVKTESQSEVFEQNCRVEFVWKVFKPVSRTEFVKSSDRVSQSSRVCQAKKLSQAVEVVRAEILSC